MAKDSSRDNINQEYNSANTGLNQDNTSSQIDKGRLTYALNAAVENFDASSVNYQNEPGNKLCLDFPEGYVLIGTHFIPEQNKHIYFLTDPELGYSQIGFMVNNSCKYETLACSDCLNFDVNHPIHSVAHRVTNFGTEIYWPDNNGRRYLNIDDIPKPLKEGSSLCDPIYVDDDCSIDCAKIQLQPDFSIPILSITNSLSGGEITSGTVQFAVQYSDAGSNPYTSYFGVTNPTPIADTKLSTVNFNYPVGKSVIVDISNLDDTGQFQYFNLAVIKTVNGISTAELVGTYFIDRDNKQITYTGQNKTNIALSIEDIFEKFPYYDNADYVTAVQDVLVWKGITASKRLNYQSIANKISLKWQTHRIPPGETYSDEVLATNFRGYLRDEVYAFEISFLLSNGEETDGFHIPGREKNAFEISAAPIYPSNPDFVGSKDDGKDFASYWKIYNTATVIGTSPEYSTEEDYKGPYQYGEFAYWESAEEYPCNEDIWGELAGKKVRHHKFPDNLVSPMFETGEFPGEDNLVREDKAIFPLGVKIDVESLKTIIAESTLTTEQKENIVGFKILRGDRGVNKSIIAKGLLRNVNKYTRDDQEYFYPNYPYNDVKTDPFVNATNNAWAQITKPFLINIVEFNLPIDENGVTVANPTYAEIEYKDPNTNKDITKKFTTLGEQDVICSSSKPIVQGPGEKNKVKRSGTSWIPDNVVSTVRTLNYDIYRCRVDKNDLGFYKAGFRMEWNDPIEGTKSRWFSGSDDILLWCVEDTKPINISSGSAENNENLDFIETTSFEDPCGTVSKLPSILENEDNITYRQVFNSPDTSFGQPFLGSILKMENVVYGPGSAHFVEVKDNAKYRLLTEEAQKDALIASEALGAITSSFDAGAMFTAYQAYLEIYLNGITRKNYGYSFNSIASYNYSKPIPNDSGIKQRELDIKKYLIPEVQNVGEIDININNYNRETSVYLRTKGSEDGSVSAFPLPHKSPAMLTTGLEEHSRFTIGDSGYCATPGKEQDIKVVSYYGSLKNEFINQWGQIYSYDTINTGYTVIFGKEYLSPDTIFGGDTFIGRFSFKTKVPFFIDNRVNAPDDSDIFYDEIGNIAYPKYWHSARSILSNYTSDRLSMYNMVSYKAHNFDCPNNQGEASDDLISSGADPADNPDRTFYDGYMYMFSYGVPSFYCESSYNLDLRTAFNNKEGEFWPHVSTGIPDEWVQESNVSILNDNTYNYNTTFSKQNKESSITHLPEDWTTDYLNTNYPFRAIYSDVQNTDADNRVNNWLIYRALSYHDFPQNFGSLTALDGLANKAVLARFENKSLLYNSLVVIDTSNPQAAYVGNPRLFENQPIDYADTDLGYIGSQNKFLLKIPQGALFTDAKRGQVFLVNGQSATDLTAFGSGMNRFFREHLSFEILKHFSDVDTDNHFNGIGLHGVYDAKYNRVILTKLDYVPLLDTIEYNAEENKFYNVTDLSREVFVSDQDFFCNKSFTISFNFNTKSWISFHSYLPNYYIGDNKTYYSGNNYCPNDFDALVGVQNEAFNTTTTTTTRVIIATTTTTTTEFIPDCDIVVTVSAPSCNIEGTGVIIYVPEACTRPIGLQRLSFISGYDLVSPNASVDSTGSFVLACDNLTLFSIYGNEDDNYTTQIVEANVNSVEVGENVYAANNTDDCTTIADGWYFTDETASEMKSFRVESGVIVEEYICGTDSTTTTTTTTLATSSQHYTGVYTEPDSEHPLGGVIQYVDAYGDTKTLTGIWDDDCIEVVYSSIISTTGVGLCTP